MRASSPASLTARNRSTAPAQGTSSHASPSELGEARVLGDRESRLVEAEPPAGVGQR